MKKIFVLILFSVLMLFSTDCYATTFSNPVKIGSYWNSRAGGPSLASAEGYTSSGKATYTFGEGASALTFVYENFPSENGRGSSATAFVMSGATILENLKCGDVPELYKTTSDDGTTVYIGKGVAAGLEQVFFLVARSVDGNICYITMEQLAKRIPNIEFLDNPDAVRLGTPICNASTIQIPFRKRNDNGFIYFKWDADKKDFSVSGPALLFNGKQS